MEMTKTTTDQAEPSSEKKNEGFRTEIDTSAPFESVKEAVNLFGGLGYWKPLHHKLSCAAFDFERNHLEELDGERLEERARVLEKELILKERETLEVLKELESAKRLVEGLKLKLQKEEAEVNLNLQKGVCDQRPVVEKNEEKEYQTETSNDLADAREKHEEKENQTKTTNDFVDTREKNEEKENQASQSQVLQPVKEGDMPFPLSSPGLILMQLKQAKLNLTKTTTDLADVRASVESLNKKLEKERISLEKTRERLTQNSSKISSLEGELNQTRLRLQVAKDAEIKCASGDDPSDITVELQRLSSEAEYFRKRGESAKSEVLKTMSEIEQTKAMIKTADLRLVAERKMKEAIRAAEAFALAEINALANHKCSPEKHMQKREGVTLSFEEYNDLVYKARNAEEQSKKRVANAMLEVDEANWSQMVILKRVEEATEEVETSKKALEEALERVEAADRGKLEVEEALRKWRSEGHKRRSSMHNSTKFKNSGPSDHRRDFTLLDVNGSNLLNDEAKPVLKPTLSIGQILSRKLLIPEESEARTMHGERISAKRKVSLGQMLGGKHNDVPLFDDDGQVEKENGQKQFSGKRKIFGFARFSHLLSKQQKKKKKTKPTLSLR